MFNSNWEVQDKGIAFRIVNEWYSEKLSVHIGTCILWFKGSINYKAMLIHTSFSKSASFCLSITFLHKKIKNTP